MRVDSRGRITLPDVLFVLMSLAFLAALYPVLDSGFEKNWHLMSTGSQYLYQMILPVALIVLLSVIWVKATAGVRR